VRVLFACYEHCIYDGSVFRLIACKHARKNGPSETALRTIRLMTL
jgi:hypothetical protein